MTESMPDPVPDTEPILDPDDLPEPFEPSVTNPDADGIEDVVS